jgi:hypothetical protein
MKAPGSNGGHACTSPTGDAICWVATSSKRCWAVSSADTAPALTDDAIESFAAVAASYATPLDNTDPSYAWRKKMVGVSVAGALRELRRPIRSAWHGEASSRPRWREQGVGDYLLSL